MSILTYVFIHTVRGRLISWRIWKPFVTCTYRLWFQNSTRTYKHPCTRAETHPHWMSQCFFAVQAELLGLEGAINVQGEECVYMLATKRMQGYKNGLTDDLLDVTLKQSIPWKTETSLSDAIHALLKRRVVGQDQKKLDVITNDVLKKARSVAIVQSLSRRRKALDSLWPAGIYIFFFRTFNVVWCSDVFCWTRPGTA